VQTASLPQNIYPDAAANMMRTLRWGDLMSLREMYAFTIADAWGSLPTLFAMFGVALGCVTLIYIIKRIVQWIVFKRERNPRYVLEDIKEKDAQGRVIKVWRKVPASHAGSIVHLLIETLFFLGIVISALFAGAIGDVNIWQSAIASVGIGAVITYVFSVGLQLAGCGYFMFLTNSVSVGEYWILIGGGIEGRVCSICPFYVELLSIDAAGHGRLQRVSSQTILTGNWERSFYKEAHQPIVVMDKVAVAEPPTQLGEQQQLLGDEFEDEGGSVFQEYESDDGVDMEIAKKRK